MHFETYEMNVCATYCQSVSYLAGTFSERLRQIFVICIESSTRFSTAVLSKQSQSVSGVWSAETSS